MSVVPRPPHPRLKPCRQYFYIDSEHHLIDNGIVTSARDTFNAVEVGYVDEATRPSSPAAGAPDPSAFFTQPHHAGEMQRVLKRGLLPLVHHPGTELRG